MNIHLRRSLFFTSILRPACLNRLRCATLIQSHHRYSSSTPDYLKATTPVPHDEFGPLYTIYKNPNMMYPSMWNRGKFVILPIVFVFSAVEIGAYYFEQFSLEELAIGIGMQIVVFLKILAGNYYFKNVVGFMYLTEDNDLVVSYVDKHGNRKDEKFQSKSLQFQPYKLKYLNRHYVPLVSADKQHKFKVNLRKADLVEEAINLHIGELPFE